MKETVYLESSVISYLAARKSRDILVLAHQEITEEWWRIARQRYDFFISQIVREEISQGDPDASARRRGLVEHIPLLKMTEKIEGIAGRYMKIFGLPPGSQRDALHIAFACVHKMDYLVSWNCTHIANGHTIKKLNEANKELRIHTAVICTPEELMEVIE